MRFSIFAAVLLLSAICANAQMIVPAEDAIADTLTVLLEDVSLAEMQVAQVIKSRLPSTASERKDRMRLIYERKRDLARAEQQYFEYCCQYATDEDSKSMFRMKAVAARRHGNEYQNRVYAYTVVERPKVRYPR